MEKRGVPYLHELQGRTRVRHRILPPGVRLTYPYQPKPPLRLSGVNRIARLQKQHLRLGNHTAFQQAMLANPTAPIYTDEEETEYLYPSGFERDNPVASLKEEKPATREPVYDRLANRTDQLEQTFLLHHYARREPGRE